MCDRLLGTAICGTGGIYTLGFLQARDCEQKTARRKSCSQTNSSRIFACRMTQWGSGVVCVRLRGSAMAGVHGIYCVCHPRTITQICAYGVLTEFLRSLYGVLTERLHEIPLEFLAASQHIGVQELCGWCWVMVVGTARVREL